MMGKYRVTVREISEWHYTIEAPNHDAAYGAAKEKAMCNEPFDTYFEEMDNEEVAP